MKKLSILFFVSLIAFTGFTQGVKISTSAGNPDASAILEAQSSSQGFLPPRMTTAERNAIINPADGLQIYNTTTQCLNIRIGSTWKQVCGDCDFNSPIVANNGPICEGSTLNITATSIAGATYQWSGPNGFTSNLQNPSIPNATPGASGSYSVAATLDGCTSQLQTTVATINAIPQTPVAGNDGPVCTGDLLNLTATSVMGASYNWTGPNGYSASVQNPIITSAQNTSVGTYNVTATVNGCVSASGNTNVTVNAIPDTPGTITGITSACPNAMGFVYTISAVPGANSYNWLVPAGASITSNTGTSITVTFGATPAGNITVSATNVCGTSALRTLVISTETTCSPMTFNATSTGSAGTIQTFTVPQGVTSLTIEAWGAQGGDAYNNVSGYYGARMKGTFTVTGGQQLKVLVGQRGGNGTTQTENNNAGGGGGGTFITDSSNSPLLIAGGGAGRSSGSNEPNRGNGQTGTSGANASSGEAGGQSGAGGAGASGGSSNYSSSGGGGLLTDGGNFGNSTGGKSFLNGGNGGSTSKQGVGGFGGGGGGQLEGGGGGGYSGGAGATHGWSVAGGGGSYNGGINQSNTAGAQSGPGQVIFSW